ncbi:uncharacterized protein LOC136061359 [Quercus suber]|uniref:uncharacterized protein LOC136061359 n=1 Tax=Quercus suber TaxID=58331 RepID=UPI0032E054E2
MSNYLPEEVVLEILYRLPVKSLIRFKYISKSWNSLITTPAFIHSHLTRSLLLASNSNILIVRHCLYNSYVEHYKLISNNNDSFHQIQNIELQFTSGSIKHFMLIGSANGLFNLYEQERYIFKIPLLENLLPFQSLALRHMAAFRVAQHSGLIRGLMIISYWSNVHSSVIGGSLSLLFYDDWFLRSNCCAIWVMKEYGVVDSWTKLFTIDLKQEIIRVLCLQKNGNILVEAKLPNDWELSSYDPKSQHVKNLGISGRPHYFHVDNYVENLVLLDKPNDAVSKRGACRKRQCRVMRLYDGSSCPKESRGFSL